MDTKYLINKLLNKIPKEIADIANDELKSRLDLVSRQEFDAQSQVLHRLESKIQDIETQVDHALASAQLVDRG